MSVTIYYPDKPPRALAEKLEKAGFQVELRKAGDVDGVVIVGPFGIVKGEKAVRIVVNQLSCERPK